MNTNWNWLTGGVSDDMSGDGWMPAQVFAGQKLVVVGGSSGMGKQTAADVVAAGGSAVIIGQNRDKVGSTVQELSTSGKAYGITADLSDRVAADAACQQLAADHADATLLVNAAGLFVPKPFLDHNGADYDSYAELNRAIFFLTQTVAQGDGRRRAGRVDRQHRQHVGAPGDRRDPVVGLLAGQGRAARAHPQPGARAGTAPDPGQRGRARRGRHPDLRAVRAQGPARGDAAQLRRASTRWAGPAPSATWPTRSRSCCRRPPAGSPARSGTSTAASWPDATSPSTG